MTELEIHLNNKKIIEGNLELADEFYEYDNVFTILVKGSFVVLVKFYHLNPTTNGCSFLFT